MKAGEREPLPWTLKVTTSLVPFGLVLYLALRGGGYDSIVRDQFAAVLWLALVVSLIVGFLPVARVSRPAWWALGLLAAFLAWNGLSAVWSDSAERSLDTVPLLGLYLAVLALAVMTSSRETFHRTLSAVAVAIALVAAIALASRYAPGLFPVDRTIEALPDVASRLKYPLGSWNGLASFIGMGIPLLLSVATDGRSPAARVLAAAALPVMALAIGYTISRGGVLVALLGALLYVILHPRRLAMAPTLAVVFVGTGMALIAAARFEELRNLTPGFESQQAPMAAITVGICVFVAAAMVLLLAAERRGLRPELHVPRRVVVPVLAALAVAGVATALVVGVPGKAADAWEQFKSPAAPGETTTRLASASGNLRFQQWESALAAVGEAPVGGRGAGTFEFWWARETEVAGYTRYAHSLYFESLAETGLVGGTLILALVGGVLVVLIRRTLVAKGPTRAWLSGATASAVVFALAMAIDWGWALPAIPVAFFLVAAAGLQSQSPVGRVSLRWRWKAIFTGIALILLVATVVSLIATQRIVDSREAARSGDLDAALDAAEDAATLQPHAATPHLQKALVLEEQGEYDAAAAEAATAVRKDFYNWQPRWVLARIAERGGNHELARVYFEQARQYNPLSPYFTQDQDQSALTPLE